MNKLIKTILPLGLALLLFTQPISEMMGGLTAVYSAEYVSAPSASLKAGSKICSGTLTVAISCKTSNVDIYYSTGGTYKLYSKPITLTKTTTVKCYAVKNNTESKTVSFKYKLFPKTVLSADGGRYYTAQSVKLSSPVSGVKFYYTLDGSLPTTSSNKYISAIIIDESCTLRILARKSGWSSYYINKDYTIAADGKSLAEDYEGKYLFCSLSASEKLAYERLYKGVEKFDCEIDISDIDYDKVRRVFHSLRNDNPHFFGLTETILITTALFHQVTA